MGSEDFRPEEAPVREVEGESAWTPDHDPATASDAQAATYTIKGGSFLCAPNFCMRYRPAGRRRDVGAAHRIQDHAQDPHVHGGRTTLTRRSRDYTISATRFCLQRSSRHGRVANA